MFFLPSKERPAVLGSLLEERGLTAALVLAGAAQVALVGLHLPGWPCAFRAVTGLPCPGCGMSRSVAALVRGHWREAMAWHAFGPLALAVAVLMVVAAVLPAGSRHRLAEHVAAVERRTGSALVLAAALLLYWILRLLYTPLALPLR
jgi:uncharacterized protein DUF2752